MTNRTQKTEEDGTPEGAKRVIALYPLNEDITDNDGIKKK